MRDATVAAGLLWALVPLAVTLCELPHPPGACTPPRTPAAERACSRGPEAVGGAARLLFGGRLDANRATAPALQLLPGIGPKRAAAIVAARAESPFWRLESLTRIHGIGPATVDRLRPWLRVGPGVAEEGSGSPPSGRGPK